MREHFDRLAAEDNRRDTASPVRGHHDQITLSGLGGIDDCLINLFVLDVKHVASDTCCAGTAQRQLTANVLTSDELSPQARNVLRRWVLSARYDHDPAGAIAELHWITMDGRGGQDEVITLAEMSYLYGEKTHQRPYFLAVA